MSFRNHNLLATLASLVGANFFVYYFVNQENYIYFWDYANYWLKFKHLAAAVTNAPSASLSEIFQSIRYDDYNLLQAAFLIPFSILFGDDRVSFISATATLYLVPSAVIIAIVTTQIRCGDLHHKRINTFIVALFSFLLLPAVFLPVLWGYPDIAGLVIIGFALLSYFRHPPPKRNFKHILIIGISLAFLILIRRWYAFWVVGFFGGAVITETILALCLPKENGKAIWRSAAFLSGVGATAVASFFAVATPIAIQMATTNYAEIYSAYKGNGPALVNAAKFLFSTLGPATSFIFALGIFYGFANRRYRACFLFLTTQFVVILLLFTRVQDFGPHHVNLLIPTIVIVTSIFVVDAIQYINCVAIRRVAAAGYFLTLAVQFAIVFFPATANIASAAAPFLSRTRHYPLQRYDLDELRKLVDTIAFHLNNNKDQAYVIASSIILNDDILRNACYQFGHPSDICARISPSAHVDKRDGLSPSLFTARYIILATPIQYHLRPEDQRVIAIPAEAIQTGRTIGAAFKALPGDFHLDNDVRVVMYEKIRPIEPEESQAVANEFRKFYSIQ
ncbi:hypothetical protein [Methylococcus geothermalis]|uniref:Glycosyltransferase RgtA/B/C/D-like domain-containing protein n=1 Tax=Methylococcus geothermalis TaxID=2681310 RepID=A0A858QBX4_9GAMM|nr:hypothetical protein [Methylococcus geothermalis]QJD31205.1 hypothetical protein GNH96_15510 [Methylococcus geothermalis]